MIAIKTPRNIATGLSLVELMVAITISSVLLLGVSSVYLSTRQSNAVQDEFSRLQENGRFGIHTLIKETRMAGYQGCANLKRLTPANIVDGGGVPDAGYDFSEKTAVIGHTACSGGTGAGCTPATPVGTLPVITATEALTIRRSSSCASTLTGNLGTLNANIQLSPGNPCNFQANEVLFISDCKNGDIFRATNVSTGSARTTIAHSNAGNITNNLSKLYGEDARVMKWERLTYFIGPSTNGIAGNRSLFVNVDQGINNVTTELVENVDDMQIQYHVDNSNNEGAPTVNAFMTGAQVQAGDLWDRVLAIRIHLLLTTRDNVAKLNAGSNATPFKFMGVNRVSTDRRYRREFTATINIRNRTL